MGFEALSYPLARPVPSGSYFEINVGCVLFFLNGEEAFPPFDPFPSLLFLWLKDGTCIRFSRSGRKGCV